MPLLEEVTFFMVWFDPDLPVLRIDLNNTGPTARLTARCYRARIPPAPLDTYLLLWRDTLIGQVELMPKKLRLRPL